MKKIYLAIPYSGMEESSYRQANQATAIALKMGLNVFSPISHSHQITKIKEGADIPGSWEFWRAIDFHFIDWADEVWILIPEEGIEYVFESKGVTEEFSYATDRGKPTRYFTIDNRKESPSKLIEVDLNKLYYDDGFE